jgi:periplasmic divalent cation tolerance protein
MAELRIVFVTIAPAHAEAFVRTLCEERLIACGNIVPGVRSMYWWEGELCDDEESIVFMETATDRLQAAMERMRALHPYDCPKLVAIDPAAVNDDYVRWALRQTRPV